MVTVGLYQRRTITSACQDGSWPGHQSSHRCLPPLIRMSGPGLLDCEVQLKDCGLNRCPCCLALQAMQRSRPQCASLGGPAGPTEPRGSRPVGPPAPSRRPPAAQGTKGVARRQLVEPVDLCRRRHTHCESVAFDRRRSLSRARSGPIVEGPKHPLVCGPSFERSVQALACTKTPCCAVLHVWETALLQQSSRLCCAPAWITQKRARRPSFNPPSVRRPAGCSAGSCSLARPKGMSGSGCLLLRSWPAGAG